MYTSFYAFKQKPFSITPNPEFLFLSQTHKEVFAHLLFGIQNRVGFIEVTGEVGTGKTTVLRTLLNQLGEDSYRLAFIFNPCLSALELLQAINREFGVTATASSRAELQAALNDFLLRENRAGRTVVLVIDEAQNLQPEVLEEIRLLSNLETETDKLIQIVLVGQPELAAMLEQPNLRQLSQRITVRYNLQPMDFADSRDYINHRLRIAGHQDEPVFAPAAIKEIFSYSRGYPRLINVLCDRSLLVGYAQDRKKIGPSEVKTAISELGREAPKVKRSAAGPLLISLLLLAAAALAGYLLLDHNMPPAAAPVLPSAEPVLPAAPAEPLLAEPETAPLDHELLARVRSLLADLGEQESEKAASRSLLGAWNVAVAEGSAPVSVAALRSLAGRNDLEMTVYSGSFEGLLDMNLPCMLELLLPGVAEPRYLTLLQIDQNMIRLSPELAGQSELPLAVVQSLWTGRAILLWKNHTGIEFLGQAGRTGDDVLTAQRLLNQAGYPDVSLSGFYDQPTINAVTAFQAAHGLAQDGRIGPQTLILLYQAAASYTQPVLVADREQRP